MAAIQMKGSDFERLAHEHKDAVYRQMVRVCNHREDAEDALASALLLAFEHADQLENEDAFRGWLATIGRRVCTRMRSKPRMQEVLDLVESKGLAAEEAPFDVEVLKGCVKQAVEELPDIYRDIYVACEIEEQTVAEAAEAEGITEAAAKSRLHRARGLIRDRLDHSICAV